jgi:hypothetical protein
MPSRLRVLRQAVPRGRRRRSDLAIRVCAAQQASPALGSAMARDAQKRLIIKDALPACSNFTCKQPGQEKSGSVDYHDPEGCASDAQRSAGRPLEAKRALAIVSGCVGSTRSKRQIDRRQRQPPGSLLTGDGSRPTLQRPRKRSRLLKMNWLIKTTEPNLMPGPLCPVR